MKIPAQLTASDLEPKLKRFWALSADKIRLIEKSYDHSLGSPVFTVEGRYTARGWTEWTQGFLFGSQLLQFDATNDVAFYELGRHAVVTRMAPHLTHFGVHDHGFNTISTYGTLLRLINEERMPEQPWERRFHELALKVSGAVQARRWTTLPDGGYIYSFNGPHSLFADTIRSLRVLAVSHLLGHVMMGEKDQRISLLERLIQHATATARYTVYYGEGRDAYDVRGRVAHESLFNPNDGSYRCPSSQQGFSPFTTWTRGLAWILLGYAEQLEFLASLPDAEFEPFGGRAPVEALFLKAAQAAADFYIAQTPADGIPYWDTGAPGLAHLGRVPDQPADPFNDFEPVDSSAAAIAAQGFIRLGHYLKSRDADRADGYERAGLALLSTLLNEPYLSTAPDHQGLILHSVYHRPNGWDHTPIGRKVPCGESSLWGDYHAREAALMVSRQIEDRPYPVFWNVKQADRTKPGVSRRRAQ
jgi:unsaturated chondroitin disaccharide hydrolase